MNKKIISILVFVFLIISFFSCSKKVENADAEYIEIVNEYKLNDDGSVDFIHYHKVKLNSYYAIRQLGDERIIYNPKFQDLKIIKSVTKMNNGTIVKTPDNGYNKVLPKCATKAPSYNHLREMVVTHTGLDLGSVVNFKYSLHSKKDFLPELMGEEIFATFYPIKKMIVKITIPTDKKLNYELFNSTKESKNSNNKDTKTFLWKFKNIPEIVHENNQSEIGEFSSRLVFSTIESWKELANNLKLQTEKSLEINNKIKTEIKNDLPNETDDLKKIIAI